jgi:hypothetical protein
MASRLTIELDLGNAAFEAPDTGEEIARILRVLARNLATTVTAPDFEGEVALVDVNGNRVGLARLLPA